VREKKNVLHVDEEKLLLAVRVPVKGRGKGHLLDRRVRLDGRGHRNGLGDAGHGRQGRGRVIVPARSVGRAVGAVGRAVADRNVEEPGITDVQGRLYAAIHSDR